MRTIYRQNLYSRWKSTLIWSIGLASFSLMFAGLYESFASDIEELASSYPESLQAFVGDISAAATPAGWLGIELYNLILPISLTIIAIGFGASAIGKEEESGTLELLLASPISRSKILQQKVLAIMTQLAIVSGAVWFGVAIGSVLFEFDISLVDTFWATFMAWLMAVVFAFVSLMTQSLTGSRGLALGVGTGLAALTYFALVVSKLVESLEVLKYISPFHYFSGQEVLISGLNLTNFAVLAGLCIGLLIIAHTSFARRDTGL